MSDPVLRLPMRLEHGFEILIRTDADLEDIVVDLDDVGQVEALRAYLGELITSQAVERPESLSSSADYYDDDCYDAPPGRRSSVGPGNSGSEECECGYSLSWPEGTTDEDRATMRRLWDEHEAQCTRGLPVTAALVDELHEVSAAMAESLRAAGDFLRERFPAASPIRGSVPAGSAGPAAEERSP